ncbi:PstS family phosphate ABC transporter substrate-binding protein [Chryseobacterium sp.]|uniref:PstS family phosphate ABC transporter substrate-binding protein n=1 Tax=Chryseobacterium sp. TaxID=1871047 RepID=UPI0011CBBC5B|nr:substrate-binding domain-containing protein [Chryseobacterium sp.]TXF77254.1 phosphate ABC transporter substrate-binding protein [Chryseobacterium sp.]
MKFKTLYLLICALFLLSCSKKKTVVNDYNKGTLTVVTDGSFKSVVEALTDGYMISYPDTKIGVQVQKEDLAFLDLLKGKLKLIVMSRELSEKEITAYKTQTKLNYEPARFAADAVVFIVPKDDERTSISMDEIKEGLQSQKKQFIFDGTNSSNLNFVAQKLGKLPSDLQYSILNGNETVIDRLNDFPGKIGVVGLNTFSRPYGKDALILKDKFKILSVYEKGKLYEPSTANLANMKYPFTRILYFLRNEPGFGIANGFMRFSCTQLGQMIVSKEGLQPFNLYAREVQMR